MKQTKGIVLVLTGDGKGKTTSALGMALRAFGHSMRVCIVQFIKAREDTGEDKGLKILEPLVENHVSGRGFVGIGDDKLPFAEHQAAAREALNLARTKIFSGQFEMAILDEINNAIDLGLLEVKQVCELIASRPSKVHLILTGRNARQEIVDLADTVSEIREIKHAFRSGRGPEKGLDY